LEKKKSADFSAQVRHVWSAIADSDEPISIEDPANPEGNDLRPLLEGAVWQELRSAAAATLKAIDDSGWEAAFGPADSVDQAERVSGLKAAAASVSIPTKPWAAGE
jgi:hypothetical protein